MKFRSSLFTLILALFSLNASAAIWYVDTDNGGSQDGLSWATAFKTIQPAINAAAPGDEVWVAAGLYNEDRSANATGSLQMISGVALYGGFEGTEAARSERLYKQNPTIVDGSNGRGAALKAYHVVNGADNAVFDGFIVQNGDANGPTTATKRGGGMNNDQVSPTVRNCTFRTNRADGVGAGAHNIDSSPTFNACIFHNNVCNGIGETDGTGGGGGLANCSGGTVIITNCLIYDNTVSAASFSGGGGILNSDGSSGIIRNCTLTRNTCSPRTGGVNGEGGGGAIFTTNNGSATISNCIAWGNTSTEIDFSTLSGGTVSVDECIVQGGYSHGGTNILTGDPLFVNAGANDFRLQGTSAGVDGGTNVAAPPRDLLGTLRPQGGTVDIGAYEYDVTPPIASCLNNLKFLNASGEAAILTSEVNDASSDAGGIESYSLDRDLLLCTDVPSTVVVLTVTDFAGNSATCNATITVNDPISPIIDTCTGNLNVPLNGSCQAILPDFTTGIFATDNCTIASVTQTPLAGATITNPTLVTVTVTDNAGAQATCQAFAIPADLSGPTFTTCPAPRNLFLNASCQATVPDLVVEAAATDNCGGSVTITQAPLAGSTISATTVVTLTAEDDSGNQTSDCTVILSAQDNIDPTFTTCPANTVVAADGSCAGVMPDLVSSAVATDNCGIATVVQSPLAGSAIVSPLTVVTFTATDTSGNDGTCTANVTLEDQTDPQILACSGDVTVPIGPGCAATVPDLTGGVTASDNCGTPTVTQAPLAGTSISGNTVVTLTATDGTGNTDTCTATVFIDDTTPPTITTCAANVTANLVAACEALVPDLTGDVTATDNCGILSVTQAPVAGSTITAATVVTLTVTDTAGNTSTCNATVSVQDLEIPTFTQCAPNQNVALNSSCEAVLPDFASTAIAADNCTVSVALTQSPVAGTIISGVTAVTITATDDAGNIATCIATANASDGGAPVITLCAVDETQDLNANCQVAIPDFTDDVIATDDCTFTITQDPAAGTLVSVDTLVTITVEDGGGLQSTCSATVFVQDVTGPTITRTGPSIVTLALNATYTEQGAVAEDNCDGTRPVTIGGGPVVTTAPGTFNLTYSATDTQGNPGVDATRTVIVSNDSTGPVITLLGLSPVSVNCGQGYNDPGATALDNLDGNLTSSIVVTGGPIVTTTPPGVYTLTYTVTDSSLNTTVKTRNVTVANNCSLDIHVVGPLVVQRAESDSVTFEVTVTGAVGPTTLQWEQETAPNVWTPISSENGLTYSIPVIAVADFGRYRCTVSDSITSDVSEIILLRDENAVPALGLLGLAALGAVTAMGGALGLRRRNK